VGDRELRERRELRELRHTQTAIVGVVLLPSLREDGSNVSLNIELVADFELFNAS
jgi:hypothetical protein